MTRGLTFEVRRGQHRAGGDAEAGFTLIELAASLTVLAIGIVGVIGVMNGSFRVAVNASARSKAVAVATAAYERQVDDMLAGEDDVADYVRRLEEDGIEGEDGAEWSGEDPADFEIPSQEELASEVERFLREQPGSGPS